MGTVHSSSEENASAKMPLADRRYRVSAAKTANALQRRSTRKLGSVALELGEGDEAVAGGSGTGADKDNPSESSADEEENGTEAETERNTSDNNPSREGSGRKVKRYITFRTSNRRRAQTLLQFQLTRTENAANATILLTRTQRVLIENSWKRAKKAAVEGGMGAKVFHTVLMAQPDIKLLFGLEKVPQGRLKYEGQFRRHAGLLNRSLEYIVKNVQYTDKLGHHFMALGKKHCQMNGGRAFPTNYWDTFLECIIQSVLEMDGASGGRHHRCRETGLAWRNLISFIVQQMRRGFDDERLLRKRFSASLMGLRGSTNSTLSTIYNGGESVPQQRASTGRPRPSLVHHAHGSLGSLEKMSGSSHSSHSYHHHPLQYPVFSLTPNDVLQRARAGSAVSPSTVHKPSQKPHKIGGISHWDSEKSTLKPRNESSSSARSASWCAEVSGDELRQMQLNENTPKRVTRSELVIDNKSTGGEAFYTPMMSFRNERFTLEKSPPSPYPSSPGSSSPPSRHVVSAVHLLLNVASPASSIGPASLHAPNTPARHSFSEFADGNDQKTAAVMASNRMLAMTQKEHLRVIDGGGPSGGEGSPGQQPRRLSAI